MIRLSDLKPEQDSYRPEIEGYYVPVNFKDERVGTHEYIYISGYDNEPIWINLQTQEMWNISWKCFLGQDFDDAETMYVRRANIELNVEEI